MKIKFFLVVFNVLMIFSFVVIFFLPFFILGEAVSIAFFQKSWFLAVIFGLAIAIINALFFANRRLITSLENCNWAELKKVLEKKLFEKNRFYNIYIKLYINTCISLSQTDDIKLLEKKVRNKAPKKLKKYALELGMPYMLDGDLEKIKSFFGSFIFENGKNTGWIKWNYCFALILLKEEEEAVPILFELSIKQKNNFLKLLALYTLWPFRENPDIGAVLKNGRNELKIYFEENNRQQELENQKEKIQLWVLKDILRDAFAWLDDKKK